MTQSYHIYYKLTFQQESVLYLDVFILGSAFEYYKLGLVSAVPLSGTVRLCFKAHYSVPFPVCFYGSI